jgi:hypothetical protein
MIASSLGRGAEGESNFTALRAIRIPMFTIIATGKVDGKGLV